MISVGMPFHCCWNQLCEASNRRMDHLPDCCGIAVLDVESPLRSSRSTAHLDLGGSQAPSPPHSRNRMAIQCQRDRHEGVGVTIRTTRCGTLAAFNARSIRMAPLQGPTLRQGSAPGAQAVGRWPPAARMARLKWHHFPRQPRFVQGKSAKPIS